MSKYKNYTSVIKDVELFKAVLDDLGILYEEGDNMPLYGYLGKQRQEHADLVIRRRHVSRGANDIGWKHTEDGYVAIVSDFDRGQIEDKTTRQHLILCKAMQEYSRRDVRRRYEEKGYRIVNERRVGDRIEFEVEPTRRVRVARTQVERQARVRVRR